MQTTITAASADEFKAMADATRLTILEMLADGERCVCELADAIAISQPLLSHHLKVLRDVGFVRVRREGRWNYYALDRERLEACRCAVENMLAAYDRAAAEGRPGCVC